MTAMDARANTKVASVTPTQAALNDAVRSVIEVMHADADLNTMYGAVQELERRYNEFNDAVTNHNRTELGFFDVRTVVITTADLERLEKKIEDTAWNLEWMESLVDMIRRRENRE